mmetsp:Transcript_128170/g.180822  ORF Transcript_128170/g.180822 Transcript_128170/m.180822 type:complete len:214 (+) Transcript_128170:70-711(+)
MHVGKRASQISTRSRQDRHHHCKLYLWLEALVKVLAVLHLSTDRRVLVEHDVYLPFILIHGFGPVVIALHGRALHPTEILPALQIQLHSSVHGLLERVGAQRADMEARCHLNALGDILHRVDEASGGMYNGQRPVHLRVHLREAAGLVAGWHQEQVATRHHLVLHLGVETNVAANAATVIGFGPSQCVRVLPVAISHHNQLHLARDAVARVLH